MTAPSQRLRSKTIVTIIKPSYRWYFRRFIGISIVSIFVLLQLIRDEGRQWLLIEKQAPYHDVDRIKRNSHNQLASKHLSHTNDNRHSKDHHAPQKFQNVSTQTTDAATANDEEGAIKQVPSADNMGVHTLKESDESLDPKNETEITNNGSYPSTMTSDELPAVVHFPVFLDDGIEMRMELDGLMGSKAIHLLHDVNASMLYPNLVWIGSPIPRRSCNMALVQQALEYYQAQTGGKTMKLDWTFHLLDWSDYATYLVRCRKLELLVGIDKIHYWKRSIVAGRSWNATTKSIERGHITTNVGKFKIHPLYLSTRTDIVQGIAAAVERQTKNQSSSSSSSIIMSGKELTEYLVTKERRGDVAHHWPPFGKKVDRGGSGKKMRNDLLRTTTSLTLRRLQHAPYNLSDVFSGMIGTAKEKGRESTNDAYIDSILHYKIMVVSQRDTFEGHLRLFEGLVSGAMVIHDRILALPVGLKENVNIVFFDNQDELMEKVMYYLGHPEERLAIARRGRQLAMCQSRTWHRIEQIILGRTVTPCDE